MKRLSAILLSTVFAAATASATTYVRVEKDGTKTYSDRPIPGGQPIELSTAQGYSAPPAPAPRSDGLTPEQQALKNMGEVFRYEACTLTPAPDQTFTNPESVSLGVTLRPALRPNDVAQLILDGTPVGSPNSLAHVMKPANRGSHTVSILIKDRYGRPVCESSSTFHVFQPSLLSPARKPPPRPRT